MKLADSVTPVRVHGTDPSEHASRTLVDFLLRVGRADDIQLAARIEHAIKADTAVLALTRGERDTLLGILDDPPQDLVELRGALARDHRDRRKS